MVLLVLAVIWAVVIGSWLKERAGGRRGGDSVLSFRRQLSTLRRTGHSPYGAVAPLSPHQPAAANPVASRLAARHARGAALARKRRRDILFTLLALVGLTFLLAVSLQSVAAIYAFFLCDVLLGGYVMLLRRAQRLNEERRTKVLRLDARRGVRPGEAAPVLLHRTAAN